MPIITKTLSYFQFTLKTKIITPQDQLARLQKLDPDMDEPTRRILNRSEMGSQEEKEYSLAVVSPATFGKEVMMLCDFEEYINPFGFTRCRDNIAPQICLGWKKGLELPLGYYYILMDPVQLCGQGFWSQGYGNSLYTLTLRLSSDESPRLICTSSHRGYDAHYMPSIYEKDQVIVMTEKII